MISKDIKNLNEVIHTNYKSYFHKPWEFPITSIFPGWHYCGHAGDPEEGVRRITFENYSRPQIILEVLPSGDYNFTKNYFNHTSLIFLRTDVNPLIKGLIKRYKNGAHTNFYFDLNNGNNGKISVYKFGKLLRKGELIDELPRNSFPKMLDSLQLYNDVINVCFKSKDLYKLISDSFMHKMTYLSDSMPLEELLEHSRKHLNLNS